MRKREETEVIGFSWCHVISAIERTEQYNRKQKLLIGLTVNFGSDKQQTNEFVGYHSIYRFTYIHQNITLVRVTTSFFLLNFGSDLWSMSKVKCYS